MSGRSFSERFRRGKLQKARAGWFIGGRAPYGYRYLPCRDGVGGRLEIDAVEAEFVRMLYGWLVEAQMTIRQILKRLNFGPWYPRSGRHPWSPSVVHHILSEPIYTGTAYANRYDFVEAKKPRSRKPSYTGKGCRRMRPREQWIAIAVPPIIDQELWDRAQAQLARNARLSSGTTKNIITCCGVCSPAAPGHAWGRSHHGRRRRPEHLSLRRQGLCDDRTQDRLPARAGRRQPAGDRRVDACPRVACRPRAAAGAV
jgi:site-specific DNA recombinase